jgi:hypothetical protein
MGLRYYMRKDCLSLAWLGNHDLEPGDRVVDTLRRRWEEACGTRDWYRPSGRPNCDIFLHIPNT